jgi:hypothetical protein
MSPSDLFTAMGVVVAGLAALLSGYYSKRTVDFSQRAEQSAILANQHADHSNIISANAWMDQYLCNVRQWADEACECIARAMHATKLDPKEKEKELFEAMYKLSSLIDRGRWFFPNLWSDEVGIHKEAAYRGLRQPVLDCLVEAYDLVKALQQKDANANLSNLVHRQRLFVSEVQQVLNPRRREQEILRVNAQFAISEKLAGIGSTDS